MTVSRVIRLVTLLVWNVRLNDDPSKEHWGREETPAHTDDFSSA
jgi:hypothetical protein